MLVCDYGSGVNIARVTLAAALLITACTPELLAPDQRRHMIEIDEVEQSGRWADSDDWSRVVAADSLDGLAVVDPAGVWECDSEPDVDLCAVVDTHGRVGCFRYELNNWAVAVAPTCAVDGWLAVGISMSARAL